MQAVFADQQARMQSYLEEEREKLLDAIPEWKDDAVASNEKRELIEFAKSAGYTDEEIAMVTDHRVLVLLRKAMLHDKAQKKRPVAERKIQKVRSATPGPGNKRQPSKGERARQRLAKTGRVEDAAAALLEFDE